MQPIKHYSIFTVVTLIAIVTSISAQSVKELERQRQQALQKLETTSKKLSETKKSKKTALNKLTIINKSIQERKSIISNINGEISTISSKMRQLEQEKVALENNLNKLKANYGKTIQNAYVNRNVYSKMMFVLSANSFNQSYRRLRYVQEYTSYHKAQAAQIEKITTQLLEKNDSLEGHKNQKEEVVKEKVSETQKLAKDEEKEKELLSELKAEEQKLRADLKIHQRKASELNNKIEAIIAEEIRKAEAKRAAEEAKRLAAEKAANEKSTTSNGSKTKNGYSYNAKSTTNTNSNSTNSNSNNNSSTTTATATTQSVNTLTKEEQIISGNFDKNQGRLPWPVSNGFISGHYGVQPHPILRHVTTNNKGIYIQTPSNGSARAIFEGIVTQRFSIPGSNNAVIIKHGAFRTVYANLTQISVKEGDKVSAKQVIGKIYTDDENDNKTELYFQIWKDKVLQNPENWLTK
jgi:septal ring factor EnvC (AmiA/AmiB activator)